MSLGTGIRLADLIAAICFILALQGLSKPKGARRGNLIGAAGMLLAIGFTFATPGLSHFGLIIIAMALGLALGVPAARVVKMTAIPQMVAAFNGVGGGAAALVAISEFVKSPPKSFAVYEVVEAVLGVIIGCVSFSGSVIAFLKLQEIIGGRPITYPAQQLINGLVGAGIVVLGVVVAIDPNVTLLDVVGILA
ncbi:MAG TPA: NAD(P)(+) transhydrogenase (Re/Si-specific) subunit beta, partial [Acidimicrobiales bacterium]|nr:NAD(P)(+) transhydrogenase (Re/Si-specific) subunit beta [Acidimicrobiales bacterium]